MLLNITALPNEYDNHEFTIALENANYLLTKQVRAVTSSNNSALTLLCK